MEELSARELRALEIAAKAKLVRANDGRWFVPSQSGKTGLSQGGSYYVVKPDPAKPHCTCPDFESRQLRCKHIFAVEYTIQREQTIDGETVVTETLKVSRRTYSQDWPSYNKAQTEEKDLFQRLLHQLCQGIGETSQTMGRPRAPLPDIIFSSVFKVYSTVSARRFMTDLRDARTKGYISKLPAYNTIFKYFESEILTPHLGVMIEESSLPLQALESSFAVDSSGFSTSKFVQWVQAKHHNPRLLEKREWLKVHLMCGVKTNVVTAIQITDRYGADSPQFKQLVETTGKNFTMGAVSADKAYLSAANLQTVLDHNAMPFIPFKANSSTKWTTSPVWQRMYHYFAYNQRYFMERYHERSNVESTFSMIKRKFGDSLRSRTKTAQVNEALCKILCHNLCCLIQSMFEFEIKPEFWQEEQSDQFR
jgi:transposase